MSGLEESYFELLKARKVLIVGNVFYINMPFYYYSANNVHI